MNIKQITPLNSSRPSQWWAPFKKVCTFLLSAYKKEANLSASGKKCTSLSPLRLC